MKLHLSEPEAAFEFCVAPLDAMVRVERFPDSVVIRASSDRFTEERRQFFVRELAAEGFIPDDFAWSPKGRVQWLVDGSWLMPGPQVVARTRREMIVCLLGAFTLWFVLLVGAFLQAPGSVGTPSIVVGHAARRSAEIAPAVVR